MSASGSFGVNYKKSFGTDPAIVPAKVGDVGHCPEGEFLFVQADGAITQYSFVKISDDGQAVPLTTALAGSNNLQVGVAQVAAADNEYLWVWVGGVGGGGVGAGIKGNVLASYVGDANLYTTATAGSADDTATTKIANAVGLTTVVGAAAVDLKSTGYLTVN
ncbi:MAG: hypothetical protein ACRC9R_07950 [Enterovibrio sp.]